jgi:hypothetical protein
VPAPPQMVLEPELEPHVLGEARCLAKLDQDIHVAVRSGLTPGHGAKERQRADAKRSANSWRWEERSPITSSRFIVLSTRKLLAVTRSL